MSKTKAKPSTLEQIEAGYEAAMRLADLLADFFRALGDGNRDQTARTMYRLMRRWEKDVDTMSRALAHVPARKDSAGVVCHANTHSAIFVLCATLSLNVHEAFDGVRTKEQALTKLMAQCSELGPFDICAVYGGIETDRQLALERTAAQAASDDRWCTVSEAEEMYSINRGQISRAADKRDIKTNGKKGTERRLDRADLKRWARKKRPELGG